MVLIAGLLFFGYGVVCSLLVRDIDADRARRADVDFRARLAVAKVAMWPSLALGVCLLVAALARS